MQNKNIFIVLGLARSGSTAITKGLQALGVGLEASYKLSSLHSGKGFWDEANIINGINRTVIHVNGNNNLTSTSLEEHSRKGERLRELIKAAENLLARRFHDCADWIFKDARTGDMLPFWQAVYANMQLNEHYIITVRHPLAQAYSNKKHNGQEIEHSLIAWLQYMMKIIELTQNKKRVIVSYELMLTQPAQQLTQIRDTLKIGLECDSASIEIYAKYFPENKLQFDVYDDQLLQHNPLMATSPLCVQAYDLLLQVANGGLSVESEEFKMGWQQIKKAYQQIEPLYQYVNHLLNERKLLARQLRIIKNSLPWRFIYPLRLIDDFLRKKRLTKREQRRWQHAI